MAPNFTLKPVFIGWITLLRQLPIQLFMTVWCGGMFGGIFAAINNSKEISATSFIIFGALAFFGTPVVYYVGRKYNYLRTEYSFFDDHLEFEEGFFTINKKTIKFKDIKEINLRKGILQRIYGLGTIYLATPATGSSPYTNVFEAMGFGNISASGVGIRDIKTPDDIYEKIKGIVEAASARN